MKVIGTMGWKFEWASGFYNGLVKWWLANIDGWRKNEVKKVEYKGKEFYVKITKLNEGENFVKYEGEILGDYKEIPLIYSGIGKAIVEHAKKYIIPALASLIGYLIAFTVTILWINLFSQQIHQAFITLLPIAIGGLVLYGIYRYIRKKT